MTDNGTIPVEAGDGYSKDYVETLKLKMAQQSEENAKLRAYKNNHDEKQRDVISKLQPEISTYIDDVVKENNNFAAEMKSIVEWSRECHESASLETAMPLARFVSCASAQLKRTRDEASVLSERVGSYGETCKELESIKADRDSKLQRISELEILCNDRQNAMEKLQEELAKAGVLKDKFDFSKLSSREVNSVPKDESNVEGSIESVKSNASNKRPVPSDELMSFVNVHSKAGGSHRIKQSSTTHAHLGATFGNGQGDIIAAINGY